MEANGAPGCSSSPELLPLLFGNPIVTPADGFNQDLNDAASRGGGKAFAAQPPNWLKPYNEAPAVREPLADQLTKNKYDVQLIALALDLAFALDLSGNPADVLVLTDNSDLHKALRQLGAHIAISADLCGIRLRRV